MESWSLKGSRARMDSGRATFVRSAWNRSGRASVPWNAGGVTPSGTTPLDLTTNTKRLGKASSSPPACS